MVTKVVVNESQKMDKPDEVSASSFTTSLWNTKVVSIEKAS